MANITRLDSKMRREFVQHWFSKHPRSTLTDANKELKKKFRRGMDMGQLRVEKNRIIAHLAAEKEGTRPLGSMNAPITPGTIENKVSGSIMTDLKKTTEALAKVMSLPECPVFHIVLSRGADNKVKVLMNRTGIVTETAVY